MKSTFRILFYAKWEASDEAKMLPIYVRITINGTKARFSLKIRVSEKIWDAKSGRAIGHSHEALQANSAEKLMRIFKRITTMCFKSGLMAKDPFCDVRLKKVKKDRGYLTRHELELILNYKPTKKRLEKARDVFVFCCFTGFDYSTTASLTEQNLVLADDGSMWIETHRVKTGVASKVKLLDIPLSILKKYESIRINGYLLPVLSNAKYNLYLKEIAAALGIQKRVTSHLARHTFATTVTYANGVSIESISKMLGHTKLATTQIYARIVDQTVSREMDKLSAALSGTSFSLNGGDSEGGKAVASTEETSN